jgi:hypothetical protein
MNLTVGVTINSGDTVTRQTLFNAVANALGGTVHASDLDATVQTVVSQTDLPSALPGKLWWDKGAQLLKVYVDVLDGTSVSLWMAIGPDRLDAAFLAAQPIPYGACVQLAGSDTGATLSGRYAKLPPDPTALRALVPTNNQIWANWRVIAFNQGGQAADADRATAASGSWFAGAIDGIVTSWHPVDRVHQSPRISSGGGTITWDTLPSQISGLTGPTGISNIAGALIAGDFSNVNNAKSHSGVARSLVTAATTGSIWNKVIFWGARVGRQ